MEYGWMGLAVAILLLVVGFGWILTLFGLPGNWLMVVAAGVYAWLVPPAWRIDVGWWTVAAAGTVATAGELLELAAGAWGTARAGGSRRAALLALVGSVVGGMVGAVIGLPIPVVGSILAVLLLAGAGAAAGALLGEFWKGRTLDQGWTVGKAAFWGRLLGSLGKVLAGSIIAVLLLSAIVLK